MKYTADAEFLYDEDFEQVRYVPSPNISNRKKYYKPRGIVLHDDAYHLGKDTAKDIFADEDANVSAHYCVGRAGDVTQCVPNDRRAWHAGKSKYKGLKGSVNGHALGIELNNPGRMTKDEDGVIRPWFGPDYTDQGHIQRVGSEHHELAYWMGYPEDQVDATVAICRALVRQFDLKWITTHWYISPGRKVDTNPLFPLAGVRDRVFGGDLDRANSDGKDGRMVVNTNLRRWPSTISEIIGLVPKNTRVEVERSGIFDGQKWLLLSDDKYEGWVHGSLFDPDD